MGKLSLVRMFLVGAWLLFSIVGCQVGEDDPLISLRSRDSRLKGRWQLSQMQTETILYQFNQGTNPTENKLVTSYDGRNLRAVITGINVQVLDTTIGFGFIMDIKDRGQLEFNATVVQSGLGVRSGGEDRWYWLNDDRRKSRVYLGNLLQSTQALAAIPGGPASISDFEVVELRKDLLRLSFRRRIEQVALDGNATETLSTGELEFRPN